MRKDSYRDTVGLKKEYWTIKSENTIFCGGNQKRFPDILMKRDGCGLIAAADVLGYLTDVNRVRTEKEYWNYIYSKQRYFHIIQGRGMPAWAMLMGVRKWCREEKLPYKIRWGCLPGKRYQNVIKMLSQDIPVILVVGPNFPNKFGKKCVKFYQKNESGEYIEAASTRGHYVVGLGMENGWLKISSWGSIYYINWKEFEEYASKTSFFLFTNICCISKKKRNLK